MKPIKFVRDYAFAHGGTRIERFKKGQTLESPSEDLYSTAIKDGAVEKHNDIKQKESEQEEVKQEEAKQEEPKKEAKKGKK